MFYAVIYARGKSRLELQDQISRTRLHAAKYKVKIIDTYYDYDDGDNKAGKRPAFGRLLSNLRTGDFKFIVVTDAEVISRNWGELDSICHLVKECNVNLEVLSLEDCADSSPFSIIE